MQHRDTVIIRNIRVEASVGPDRWGKVRNQPVLVSVLAHTPLAKAGLSDDVRDSIHYGDLGKQILSQAEEAPFPSLYALAESVAATTIDKGAESVEIEAEAPNQFLSARCLSVVLKRESKMNVANQSTQDKISVTDLLLHIIIGINPSERVHKQEILVTIDFWLGNGLSPEIDWVMLHRKLGDIIESTNFQTLEAFATEVAGAALDFEIADAVTVTAQKPKALAYAQSSGVQITRSKAELQDLASFTTCNVAKCCHCACYDGGDLNYVPNDVKHQFIIDGVYAVVDIIPDATASAVQDIVDAFAVRLNHHLDVVDMRQADRSFWLPKAIRRRSRTSLFCFLAFVLITFTFLRSSPSEATEDVPRPWLPKYLDWTSSQPKQGSEWLDIAIDVGEDVDELPAIPPTLQSDDDDDDDFYDSLDGARNRVAQHTWNSNGLLTTNTEAPHPIYELVRKAEARWTEKNAKASRTLEQAVKEYERRYGRAPPTGFDQWWNYVVKHNVRLPDEYDQIYRDLEPYWGIDPADLIASQRDWEAHRDSWTIGKDHPTEPVTILNTSLPEGTLTDYLQWQISPQLLHMGDLWRHVPPFRATFSPHDAPNERVEWAWKSAALDAAKRGTYLKPDDLPPRERFGWATLCAPGSPLHDDPPPIGSWPTPQTAKTFIHDHVASMDVCQHPQHLLLHGNFLSAADEPIPDRFPVPQFSYCATSIHSDIRAISLYSTDDFVRDDTRWEDKVDDRLVWRGGPTGMWHVEAPNITWRNSQRVRLVNYTAGRIGPSSSFDDSFEVVHYLRPYRGPEEPVGEPLERHRTVMNRAMMDVGFAADYGNCEGVACEIMAEELGQRDRKNQYEMGKYKYFIDVDGNGWSARFRRLMSTYSLVFKSTLFAEWFSERVQPWVHYVPVQLDYSDLYDALVFFAGDLAGDGAHDDMAKRIGAQGRDWVTKYWRKEDMVAYSFRQWLEYARVMNPDRRNMNFRLPKRP